MRDTSLDSFRHARHAARTDDGPALGSGMGGAPAVASPRSDPSLLCKYKSGKCSNRRATKRNGQLHTLCHFHRVRQNEHQRKSDRKHRMINVAKRAKMGTLGALLAPERRVRRSSVNSMSSEFPSDGGDSTPSSPMDVGQLNNPRVCEEPQSTFPHLRRSFCRDIEPLGSAARRQDDVTAPAMLRIRTGSAESPPQESPVHWRSNLARLAKQSDTSSLPSTPLAAAGGVGTPSGRLPPISFLTQQAAGKIDTFRSPSGTMLPFPPSAFLRSNSDSGTSSHAGKMA
ncbi:hypothetical protein PINS_up006838 [Pythium insidiosum]|nr:hypothetical protein PINS_up006838 [Pythium insidiosum]